MPALPTSTEVPRSGCLAISGTGTTISTAASPGGASSAAGAFGQIPGDHQGHRQFDHLRWLEPDEAQVEPALRALADLAERQHQPASRCRPRTARDSSGAACRTRAGIASHDQNARRYAGLAFDLVEVLPDAEQHDQSEPAQQQQPDQQRQVDEIPPAGPGGDSDWSVSVTELAG